MSPRVLAIVQLQKKEVRSVQAVKCLIAGDLLCGKKCCKCVSFLLDPLADGISF